MTKKKKRSKDDKDDKGGKGGNASSSTASDTDSSSETNAGGPPVDFDAAARDRFASSFKPAWQVAKGSAAGTKPDAEALHHEHALSGEISLDSIPLPPLPTDKPKRQMIGVAIFILLIILAGVVASTRSQPDEAPATASPAQASER